MALEAVKSHYEKLIKNGAYISAVSSVLHDIVSLERVIGEEGEKRSEERGLKNNLEILYGELERVINVTEENARDCNLGIDEASLLRALRHYTKSHEPKRDATI